MSTDDDPGVGVRALILSSPLSGEDLSPWSLSSDDGPGVEAMGRKDILPGETKFVVACLNSARARDETADCRCDLGSFPSRWKQVKVPATIFGVSGN